MELGVGAVCNITLTLLERAGEGIVMGVSAKQCTVLLVTPVWNDSRRLGAFGPELARALASSGLPVRWIIADDGSTEAERGRLADQAARFRAIYPEVEVMHCGKRSRKGGAVYDAWDRMPDAETLAFVDADGAVGAQSMIGLLRLARESGNDAAVVGVRHDAPETPVRRPLTRRLSFHLFRMVERVLLGVRYRDTQCGAKVIPGNAYRALAGRLHERGFAFDAELLLCLQAQGCRVIEVPIPWSEQSHGKVKPWRDAWSMLAALWRIRLRRNATP